MEPNLKAFKDKKRWFDLVCKHLLDYQRFPLDLCLMVLRWTVCQLKRVMYWVENFLTKKQHCTRQVCFSQMSSPNCKPTIIRKVLLSKSFPIVLDGNECSQAPDSCFRMAETAALYSSTSKCKCFCTFIESQLTKRLKTINYDMYFRSKIFLMFKRITWMCSNSRQFSHKHW